MLNIMPTKALYLYFPAGNHEQAAVREVARALEEIAAQFEDRVVAQATRNLSNNILNSDSYVST